MCLVVHFGSVFEKYVKYDRAMKVSGSAMG